MAKLVFGMNQSLDGYVDHDRFSPDRALFRYFIEHMRSLSGVVYGRGLYLLMRYWDDDLTEWTSEQREFAAAWRKQPKWVISRSLNSVGPNATLIADDPQAPIRELKERLTGEIEIGGPHLANSLGDLGLIDEYQIYLHPVVLGQGTPFFGGARKPLRLTGSERITDNVMKLTYVPC